MQFYLAIDYSKMQIMKILDKFLFFQFSSGKYDFCSNFSCDLKFIVRIYGGLRGRVG